MTSSTHHSGHHVSTSCLAAGGATQADVRREGSRSPQPTQFLATQFRRPEPAEGDSTDMSTPQAYLVYLLYDNNFNIVPASSGAHRVENPNHLEQLLVRDLDIKKDGFLHVYVSNGSAGKGVSFDNFLISSMRGKTRQINHYYPYGLRISGLDGYTHDYNNMYTGKELQTGEFYSSLSTGLEMYDFHARFYDPQLGRWFAPDPAEQFSNPYLAMGNNPVSYIDPDGEFAILIGIAVGAYIGGTMANDHGNPARWNWEKPAETIAAMAIGGAIGAFGGHGLAAAKGKSAFFGMSKGSKATAAAGKKYFGATVGGTVNSISEYDGKDSFGWGTLGDFGAGFGGSYVGISNNSMVAAFNAGGALNALQKGARNGFEGGLYSIAQNWVGGGLSSMAGAYYGGAGGGFNLFGENANFLNKTANYGLQASAYDFAYTKKDDYLKRKWYEHATIFAASGLSASLFSHVGARGAFFDSDILREEILDRSARVLGTGAVSFFDVGAQRLAKGSYSRYYDSRSMNNKFGISLLKSFLYPFK